MKEINKQIIEVFRQGSLVLHKTILLKTLIDIDRSNETLLAILTVSYANKKSSRSLSKLRGNMKVVPQRCVSYRDIDLIYAGDTIGIISEESMEILSYLLSPMAYGMTTEATARILSSYPPLSLERAHEILYLPYKTKDTPKVSTVNSCGVCGRVMKSVSTTEGVCSSCKELLPTFMEYRRGPFVLPLHPFNIPRFEKHNEVPISFQEGDFIVTKVSPSTLVFTNTKPVGILNIPLPIEEYAKRIFE